MPPVSITILLLTAGFLPSPLLAGAVVGVIFALIMISLVIVLALILTVYRFRKCSNPIYIYNNTLESCVSVTNDSNVHVSCSHHYLRYLTPHSVAY